MSKTGCQISDAELSRLTTAFHEAGHAVAAVALGNRVHHATVDGEHRTPNTTGCPQECPQRSATPARGPRPGGPLAAPRARLRCTGHWRPIAPTTARCAQLEGRPQAPRSSGYSNAAGPQSKR